MEKQFLQIQPQYALSEEWEELANRENLYYEPIEFFMPHVMMDPDLQETVQQWYRESGRVRSLHGAFIDVNPASGDPDFRLLSQKRSRESCEIAKLLGASHVVLHSGCFPFLRGAYLDNWAAQSARFYTALAREYDLVICVENSQDVDPTPLTALMKRIDDPRVGVCLDIGHANYSRVPISQWFDCLGERIVYLHLSDNRGEFDDHLPLGKGVIDWAQVHSLWKLLGRTMPITLEVGGLNGVEQSLRYLKEHKLFGAEG